MKRKVLFIVLIMITLITLVLVTLVPLLRAKNIKKSEEEYNEVISKIEDASKRYFTEHNIEDLNTIYNYDILFVLDTSSTMNGNGSTDKYRLLNSINSINSIMQTYSNYKYSIVTYNSEINLLLELDNYTKTSDVFIKAIKKDNIYQRYSIGNFVYNSNNKKIVSTKYDTNNGSNLIEGLNTSINNYLESTSSNTPLVFIITDGNVDNIDSKLNDYKDRINELRNEVYTSKKKNLGIYVIGFDIKNELEKELFNLSDSTSIKSFYSVDEITNIIKNNISNRSDSYIVSVEELINLGYLSETIDPRNNNVISGKVIISSVLKDNNNISCKKTDETNYCEYIFNYFE